MIVLFHRPEGQDEQIQRRLAIKKYEVQELDDGSVKIYAQGTWMYKLDFESSKTIAKPDGKAIYALWYLLDGNRIEVKRGNIINPYSFSGGYASQNEEAFFLGRIHFESDGRVLLYLSGRFANLENVQNIELEETQGSFTAMADYSQEAKDWYEKIKVKRNLVNFLDPLDSISYLEAQVDVLTKLVLQLLNKQEQIDAESAELLQLLEEADKYSVLNIKSTYKVADELGNKEKMRQAQEQYYKDMQGL